MRTHSSQAMHTGLTHGLVLLLTIATWATPHLAHAQAVERNLPPVQTVEPKAPVGLAPIATEQDDTPFGQNLRTIVFLGANDAVTDEIGASIDTSRVKRMHDSGAAKHFSKFLNKPLSRQLIGQVQAEIARFYRVKGYPFVSFSTPEQELSNGVLQIRVLEFTAGQISVEGVQGGEAKRISRSLRVKAGEPINSTLLSQDLEWQNRNYFRSVEARFKAGEHSGAADLDIIVKPQKPWRVYGGYTNSGSPSSGRDRIFAGAMIGRLPLDATVSYQTTASPDFFYQDGKIARRKPDYLSHGARIALPTAPRQQFEVTLSAVDSNQSVQVFDIAQKTQEATAAYRSALSNFVDLPGDIVGGIEFKRQKRSVYFGETEILLTQANIYQAFAEWNSTFVDKHGRTTLSFGLHASPGGIDRHNSSAALADISNGRVTDDRYAYLTADFTRVTALGNSWTVVNKLSGQFSRKSLPLASQMGLGGPAFVRIYTSDDSSFDRGAILRSELRLPTFSLMEGEGGLSGRGSPYMFFDIGYGEDLAADTDVTVASVGAGLDLQIKQNFSVSFGGGRALRSGLATKNGQWRIETAATLSL